MHGIDGLRAFAALWVVLFHMGVYSGGGLGPGLDFIVRSGSTGVSLFLVLSGLCLYLPYAGGRSSRFTRDAFFRRRIKRLLPAYYVSLVILLVLHAVANGRWGLLPYSSSELAMQGVTHATLTHQLFPETFYGLNGAYWSLGLEWELYLTLPLLVLAAVRFGLARTVIVVVGITVAYRLGLWALTATGQLDADGAWATVVLPNLFLGRWAEFALGMLAAEWFRTKGTRVGPRQMVVALGAALLALLLPDNPLNHVLYGIFFFTLVCVVLAGGSPIARAFSWRPLVAVGVMSYSVYLVHQPILEVLAYSLGAGNGTSPRAVFLGLLLLLPVVLVVALALFATVERRSLSSGSSRTPLGELLFPGDAPKVGVSPTKELQLTVPPRSQGQP